MCNRECPNGSKKEIRDCSRCNEPFEVYPSQKQKTCSRKCPGVRETRKCERCGVSFRWLKSQGTGRFCSDYCRLAWFSQAFKGEDSPHWAGPKKYSPKRRSIYNKGDEIDRVAVFERDEWTCGICHTPIDPSLRHPDIMAATLDHIHPISLGGSHTWDNVQAAHAKCNFDKSNKPDTSS